MLLNVLERILILNLLAPRDLDTDPVGFKILSDLKSALAFSENEFVEFKITQEGTKISWEDSKTQVEKDVSVGSRARECIISSLRGQKEMTKQHLTLWERFVE